MVKISALMVAIRHISYAGWTSPDFIDTQGPPVEARSNAPGVRSAEMTVTACSIVKHLDIVEDIGFRQLPRFVYLFANTFLLQTAEEGFSYSIVPAVAMPAHAQLQVVGPTEALPVVAAVLRPLVRMHEHRLSGSTPPDRHQQGANHKRAAEAGLHRPADDLTREQVHYRD